MLGTAGATPAAGVTGRRLGPEAVRAAGYAALRTTPFDIDAFDASVSQHVLATRATPG